MEKYRRLRETVAQQRSDLQWGEAPAASDGELALAHDPAYVAAVVDGQLSAAQQREIGFPWSEAMVERSRRSVGATIAAARSALDHGIGLQLAGGTHHAYADKGSGFCVFNDVAVAARLMQAEWHRRARRQGLRCLVIDADVHQGNGTAAIFRDDASVFTLSLHGARNFPFRKEPSDLDVELPDGCTDGPYLEALEAALDAVDAQFLRQASALGPVLAFYLAGADVHHGDRLGRLALSDAGMAARDQTVLEWCSRRGLPVAVSMAGGYGVDLSTTVAVQAQTVGLCADWALPLGLGWARVRERWNNSV